MKNVEMGLFGEITECNCRLCSYHRKVMAIIASRNVDKLIEVVHDIMEENVNIGMDFEYYTCILNGSWPSSVEILERALEKAKNHHD